MNAYWRGFSLVELLVVIAVVGILASLVLPAISKAKVKGAQVKCVGNLRQMGVALHMYLGDFHVFPHSSYSTPTIRGFWGDSLSIYHGVPWTNTALHCPAYKGMVLSSPPSVLYWGSYGYNRSGTTALDAGTISLGLGKNSVGAAVREEEVLVPSHMFTIADARVSEVEGIANRKMQLGWHIIWPGPALFGPERQVNRHGQSVNVLFVDAHVERVKRDDFLEYSHNWNRDHQPHPETWVQ